MLASASASATEIKAGEEALERARAFVRSRVVAGVEGRVSEDTIGRYWADTAVIGRRLFEVWSAATRASLLSAFQLQNASLRASRAVLESAGPRRPAWLEQADESLRRGQEATAELVAAGIAMLELALPGSTVLGRQQETKKPEHS